MTTKSTKALVIGGGPGGYVCAIRLAQLGIKPIVVDKAALGGTCLTVGCIPSKAVISAAKLADKARHAGTMGIKIGDVSVDMPALIKWKDDVVKKLVGGVGQLMKGNGVEVVYGRAAFRSRNEVEVITETGPVLIKAENVVIATGSVPIEIPGFKTDGQRVLDSTGALELQEVPGRLVVIGGGYIGLELGIAYAKLGSKVTVVEAMDQILPGFDPEIARHLDRKLKKLGIEVFLKAKAKGWSEGPRQPGPLPGGGEQATHNEAIVGIEVDGQAKTLMCDKVLVTVGRKPFTGGLNLENAGLKLSDRGFIEVNDRLQTSVPGIYAIGDIVGQPMLAHKASREGEIAAEVIAGHKSAFDARCIPAVVFTDPEIATAGIMEPDARKQGYEIKVGRFPFAALGRAMTAGETDGMCKVIMDARTEEILGVAIIGPNASDLIAEAALAIEMGAVFTDIAFTIHSHPTLPEALKEAVLAAKNEAIHALPAMAPVKA